MKIAMLLFKDIVYDARVQREAISLAEKGYLVHVYCVKEYDLEVKPYHDNIVLHRLKLTAKSVKGSLMTKGDPTLKRKLLFRLVRLPIIKLTKDILSYREYYKKVCSKLTSDINYVHCHDLNTLVQGYYLSKRLGAKLIYDSHELYNEMAGRNQLDKMVGHYIEQKFYNKADLFITVNKFLVDEFSKKYGIHSNVQIVQNIPFLKEKHIHVKRLERCYFRRKYQLNEEDVILIYQGGVNPHRGLEESIEALSHLPEHFKLVFVGSGRIIESLKQLAIKSGVENRVFFHNQVPSDKLLWYTAQADIGLVMYKNSSKNNYYSTPNKIFEYLLAGIPCVASDHPGKKYIVNEHKTGVCVGETPLEIKEGILEIYRYYKMYEKNCLIASEKISWETEKQNLLSGYQKLNGNWISDKGEIYVQNN
ncbi:glycosyltransferase [Metabacillus halosaccharovorans]|uniref:glycosyltransferase n=1 Tax=Metabacillus halosaccharovorans TaxID=930124 RepID=UPI002040B23C|nr:glycosyltransferase [Metabacillus halosaccharovorans]MCM3443789.1 glycosyltransferase [Metabacillus halosaccharovorans]